MICPPLFLNYFMNAEIDGINGFMFNGVLIPREILMMLLNVIEVEQLFTISTVCKNWCIVIRSYSFWNAKYWRKCGRPAEQVPWYVFYCLFTRKCFTNMLTNCNGENGTANWYVGKFGTVAPLPKNDPKCKEFTNCFKTSAEGFVKIQEISLRKDSLLCFVINIVRPAILLNDWVSAKVGSDVAYCACTLFFGIDYKFIGERTVKQQVKQFGEYSWIEFHVAMGACPLWTTEFFFKHSVDHCGIWQGDSGIKLAGTVLKFDFQCISLKD